MAPPYSSGYRKVPTRGCRGRGPTPVAGEPAGHPRGKDRVGARHRTGLREHRKPGVVRARVQTPEPPLRLPADPAVARPAPGRAALPAPATARARSPHSAGPGRGDAGNPGSGACPPSRPKGAAPWTPRAGSRIGEPQATGRRPADGVGIHTCPHLSVHAPLWRIPRGTASKKSRRQRKSRGSQEKSFARRNRPKVAWNDPGGSAARLPLSNPVPFA